MENKIKLVMNENKNLTIYVNSILKHTITENEREISAQRIYDLFDYKSGDTYIVISENEKVIDEPVLRYFKELFDDICKRINEMNVNEEDAILKVEAINNCEGPSSIQ